MNTELVKDILLKGAEDVTSGMWCKGRWFERHTDERHIWPGDVLSTTPKEGALDQALASRRCAEGSLAVATGLLGGGWNEWALTLRQVLSAIPQCDCLNPGQNAIAHFNDAHLPDDPFEAGQQLAELFRSTAEAL